MIFTSTVDVSKTQRLYFLNSIVILYQRVRDFSGGTVSVLETNQCIVGVNRV